MSACDMFYNIYVDGCVRTCPVDSIMCPWIVVGGVICCISIWTVAFALVRCSEACMAARAWLRMCARPPESTDSRLLSSPYLSSGEIWRYQEKCGGPIIAPRETRALTLPPTCKQVAEQRHGDDGRATNRSLNTPTRLHANRLLSCISAVSRSL